MQIQHSKVLQKAHPTAAKKNESVTGLHVPAAAIPVNENNCSTIAPTQVLLMNEDKVLLILFRF
jgi:hypothetical protein